MHLSCVFTVLIIQVLVCDGQSPYGDQVNSVSSLPRTSLPFNIPPLPSLAAITGGGRISLREMVLNLVDIKIKWLRDLRAELRNQTIAAGPPRSRTGFARRDEISLAEESPLPAAEDLTILTNLMRQEQTDTVTQDITGQDQVVGK